MLQTQNNQFLTDVLFRNYFLNFQRQDGKKELDFIFSNSCPYNCPQCYLSTEKQLYPNYEEKICDNIFSSYAALLDWYEENKFFCNLNLKNCNYEVNTVLDMTYKKFISAQTAPKKITLYINPKTIQQIDFKYFELFKNINIPLILNIFANGLFCDDEKYTEEDYLNIFNLVNNNCAIVTAYVTPENVHNWIMNYKWWISNLSEKCFESICIKEFKNDKWTKKAINKYISFLDFQIDFLNSLFPEKSEFIDIFFSKGNLNFNTIELVDQGIITNKKQYMDCDFHNNLTIDVNTLRLLLCSEINYHDFTIGYFNIETKMFEANNAELIILKAHLKRSSTPHCEKCALIGICDGFSYGQSYNKIFNPLIPIKESCEFNFGKYNFLIYKYNILSYIDSPMLKNKCDKTFYKYLFNLKENIKNNLEE